MNKYTKMKAELENQKKYNLQLSTNIHKQQKRKSRIMSSSYKVNQNINNPFIPSYLFRITHFSHYFARNKINKRTKTEIDENEIKLQKIKEELDNNKKDYEKNENSYISKINMLNKEIEELKKEKENLEEKIKEIILNKNKEIEKEKQNKHRMIYEEKEKNKKEIEKLNKEILLIKEELDKLKKENEILKEENIKIKKENEDNKEIKKVLEEYKQKEKNYEKIINELKIENEKLLSQTTLHFKLIKEENDELTKNIKQLNETINIMKKKEKEYIEQKEKEKKEINIDKKYSNNNLKVMRIFSNKFIFKNNNIPDIITKLKETEKKYNELKKEKENIARNNQSTILVTKEIKLLKDKYEKEMKELKEKNINLNNQIKIIKIKKTINNGITNEEIKKVVGDITDHFNKIITATQSRYDNKLFAMKQKLVKIRGIIIKYIKNKNKEKNEETMIELKEEILKIEKEKQKMKVQISNYDINFKKQNNEITRLKNELSEANKKLNKLNNEIRWNNNDKHEMNDMNKKLKKQLEMYIIENSGKSKVIEERNNEITKLKELLSKKQ